MKLTPQKDEKSSNNHKANDYQFIFDDLEP